ncbi:MAG: pyridoxal phosphate-dependent aminotransferase, partial [Deltaproteobacteria bacterium]|nr:pyridoxal phosphate-dependent aminotransferase [Deltaproteobacteria bacterium]
MNRIYLSPPHLDGRERSLLLEALKANWITTLGPEVEAFERELCEKIGIRDAVALTSGTAGLHMALLVAGVGRGDTVLCSDLTFAATANAVVYCGALPVFIDSARETWNMDAALLSEELKEGAEKGTLPKAVIAVDLYGQSADYDALCEICDQYGIPLIEDAAEALGSQYKGSFTGKFGAMGVFSFNGNKIITTSGGGMLVSDHEKYIRKARFLSAQARDPAPHYEHSQIGYNYRLSNLLAAVGRGQLERLDEKVKKKRAVNEFYRKALENLPGIEFMPEAPYGRSNCWLTVISISPEKFGRDREGVRLALEAENIETRPVWKPMHLQPVFKYCRRRGGEVNEDLFRRGLCLPSGTQMQGEDLERVVQGIKKCFRAR